MTPDRALFDAVDPAKRCGTWPKAVLEFLVYRPSEIVELPREAHRPAPPHCWTSQQWHPAWVRQVLEQRVPQPLHTARSSRRAPLGHVADRSARWRRVVSLLGEIRVKVLVTGGAGYIGSHAMRLLARGGHDVWVYDNLSLGHRAAVPAGRLIEGELMDRPRLVEALRSRQIEAVMHFAAFASVGESVADPAKYYQNNVVASSTCWKRCARRASRRSCSPAPRPPTACPSACPSARTSRSSRSTPMASASW